MHLVYQFSRTWILTSLNQGIGIATLRNYSFIIWQALWKPVMSAHKLKPLLPSLWLTVLNMTIHMLTASIGWYQLVYRVLFIYHVNSWLAKWPPFETSLLVVGTWWYCCHCLYMSTPCSGILAYCRYVAIYLWIS